MSAGSNMAELRIRVLVVDDEPLARRGIVARLAGHQDMQVIAECASGREAVRLVRELQPDLIFLDVQMPGFDGFDAIEKLEVVHVPMIVFVTAYEEHARRAFDVRALDYLLKPIDDQRFAEALERARERFWERRGAPRAGRLLVRDRGKVLFLQLAEVEYVEADGDYVRVHVRGKSHLIRETLTAIATRLPEDRFVRIHRSTIVNVDHVQQMLPHTNREFVVVLRSGGRLKLSRGYRDQLPRLTRPS